MSSTRKELNNEILMFVRHVLLYFYQSTETIEEYIRFVRHFNEIVL
jgi:hypothetical protein